MYKNMSKLKSFDQFVFESDQTNNIEQTSTDTVQSNIDEKNTVESDVEEAEDLQESKTVAEMLTEIYEGACKTEAKAYEEDAHDEHTVESYMKENAALIGALAATSLKNMQEDYSVEAYEAACNEMIEAYTKKINEMKEMDHSADAQDIED